MCQRPPLPRRITDMTRGLSIIAAGIAAIAVCALPAYAASDPHAKKAAVDPQAQKKVAAEPHAPKTAAALEPPAAKKAAPADLHAPKKAATAGANAPSKSVGADAHTSAAKTAAATREHGSPAAKGAPAADAQKLPMATDLRALNDRIQERLAEVRKGQASKPSPRSKAAGSRHIPAPPSTLRIELVWRPSLTWPQELYGGAAASAPQMPVAADRVSVAWGPQP